MYSPSLLSSIFNFGNIYNLVPVEDITKDAKSKEDYYNQGILFLEIDLNQAISCFEKALEGPNPYEPAIHKLLSIYCDKLTLSSTDQDILKKYIEISKKFESCENYFYLGRAYEALNKTDDAEFYYDQACYFGFLSSEGSTLYKNTLAEYTAGNRKTQLQEDGGQQTLPPQIKRKINPAETVLPPAKRARSSKNTIFQQVKELLKNNQLSLSQAQTLIRQLSQIKDNPLSTLFLGRIYAKKGSALYDNSKAKIYFENVITSQDAKIAGKAFYEMALLHLESKNYKDGTNSLIHAASLNCIKAIFLLGDLAAKGHVEIQKNTQFAQETYTRVLKIKGLDSKYYTLACERLKSLQNQ